jgi:hypothetical protein
MSTVQVTIPWLASFVESYTAAELPGSGATRINHAANQSTSRLNATSTPPATKPYSEELTGSQNLDLTALVRSIGTSPINCTGLKLQFFRLVNRSTTNTVDLDDGATNAYQINNGDAYRVPAESKVQGEWKDKLADVDATHKNLAITATAGQTYHLMMVFG